MPPSRTIRSHIQSVRLTRGELAVLHGKARTAGLPLSTFLRHAALGKTVRARRGQVDRDAIYQLVKVGNNINQLARAANAAGQVVALELLEQAIEDLRSALDHLTG